MSEPALDATRALYAALEAGQHGEALRPLFTDDAVTIEHPNFIKPAGSRLPLDQMLAASTVGAGLLAAQRYQVHSAIAHGELAIVRLTWTGTLSRDAGSFRAGQVLTAHLAQFIDTRGGRIARIETYDCYEPVAPV